MSDGGIDLPTAGISGLGGAGFVIGLVRLIFGSALKNLEEKVVDLKLNVEKAIDAQRSDTREQITSLKEMIQRSDQRHDTSVAKLAVLEASVQAMHARLDTVERDTPRRRGR